MAIGGYSISDYSIGGYWCLLLVIICYITTIGSYYIVRYLKYFFIGYYFLFKITFTLGDYILF